MNWYHKLIITMVVGLFLFIHQDVIVENYRDNSPVLSSEEITSLEKQVAEITVTAKDKIKSGTYSPEDWQKDVFFLQTQILQKFRGYYSREEFFVEAGKILDYTIKYYYEPKTKEQILFQQQVNEAQAKVLHDNNVSVDWSKLLAGLWSFYLSFIPFAFLIILIKRSTFYKFKFHSAGDIAVAILSTLFSVIGVFAYKPNSLLKRTIDAELKVWREKIGSNGWRLVLAYLLAILFAIGTILRPIKIYAQEFVQTNVVTTIGQSEQDNHDEDCYLPVIAMVWNYFRRIVRAIQKFIFLFFSPMFILLNIPPPRSFIIVSWQTPRDKIVSMKMIIGCRAPSVLFQFNLINRNKIKRKGIYSEKYHFNISTIYGN